MRAEVATRQSFGRTDVEDLNVFMVKKEIKKSKGHERWHISELCKRLDDADPNLANSKVTDS